MRKWNRNFFGRTRGANSGTNRPTAAACIQAQATLTAAFDGEADETALASARGHLKDCAHCVRHWDEWEKTRLLLRSIPAPAAPSSLLTQVLLACRLTSPEEITKTESEVLRAALADYLDSSSDAFEGATLEDAPLARFLQTVPTPPELQNQILQRTIAAPKPWWISLLPAAQVAVNGWREGWSTPRPLRWSMSLAVPALAAWLIFAGQTEYSQVPPAIETAPPVAVTPKAPDKTKPAASVSKAAAPKLSANSDWLQPLKGAIKRAANSLPVATPRKEKPENVVVAVAAPARPRVVAAHVTEPVSRPRIVEASLAKPPVKKIARAIRRAAGLAKARVVPAVDIVEHSQGAVVAVAAAPSTNRPSLNRIRRTNDGIKHQISNPYTPPSRLAKLTELDFEEAFIAVTSVRDDRPEDVRRALDEFRAAVLSEHEESEDDFDDL